MDSDMSISEVLHDSWALHEENVENTSEGETAEEKSRESFEDLDKAETEKNSAMIGSSTNAQHDQDALSNLPFFDSSTKTTLAAQQVVYYPSYTHGCSMSSTYHQPFISMVRHKKSNSAVASALQRPAQTASLPITYLSGYPFGYVNTNYLRADINCDSVDQCNEPIINADEQITKLTGTSTESLSNLDKKACGQTTSFSPPTHISGLQNRGFDLPAHVLKEYSDDDANYEPKNLNELHIPDGPVSKEGDAVTWKRGGERHETEKKFVKNGEACAVEGKEKDACEKSVSEEKDEEVVSIDTAENKNDDESDTQSGCSKHPKSHLEALLLKPVKKLVYQEYQPPFAFAFSALDNQSQPSSQQSSKTMQFYQQPAQQHLARSTPPPGFAQPYGMGMRPHEEETRQIMNLDNQQTHSSSPTSSWNQQYGQMTNLNAYQTRPPLYAPPVPPSMVHQNGPPGVVPTSNPYYQTPVPPQHHHMQPQAPMMAPGLHGQQQQQPYYNTQSPLTGTPPSMNYGTPQMPAPPPSTNGSAPIFNFSKPRSSNEGSSTNGSAHRRKKHNDLSSPRYNSNSNEDIDGSIFPDMADFPLLDVVQSKAKKDAGRKPCRPHLCEQSRMLISRVCHFHREFVKRLPARHPLANSPFSKPDQWTSQIMGISLATVRKCIDMAVDEEVFTRCTDKNLVNLTPSERAEREELLSKLSTVFEDEKSLGAGTAGMTIAEYSPRRSYSNTVLRQSTDDKSSNSSFATNGADYGSSETTLLNLDDHSNSAKEFGPTPTPATDLSNGGQIFEEIGAMRGGSNELDDKSLATMETPKRGRPRKAPGTTTAKASKRKELHDDNEVSEDKEDHEKKTEDEDETTEETEKKTEELQQLVIADREDDAASSEGTNRSESATPEPAADTTTVAKKTRAAARRKNTRTADDEFPASAKKKRGSVTSSTAGNGQIDDENSDHKMVTRARSRQP